MKTNLDYALDEILHVRNDLIQLAQAFELTGNDRVSGQLFDLSDRITTNYSLAYDAMKETK